jgi:two-component system response regulator AtoC
VLALQPGENLVGRGDEAGVRIDSAKVSRVHARIAVAASSATVEDLGSKNGTFVRGRRIAGPVELTDGDEICLGSVLLVFRRPSAPRSTETEST